jgi:putative DNA primase/helicase
MSNRKAPQVLTLSKDTPHKTAEAYLARHRPHLLNQQDEFLDYRDGAYVSVEDATIRAELNEMMVAAQKIPRAASGQVVVNLPPVSFNPKSHEVSDAYKMLADKVHKPANAFSPPCWLDGRDGPDPQNIICVENGLLDIETRELLPHTPAFFTRTKIPCRFDELADDPKRWLEFLDEVTDNRPQLVTLLQEMIGYKLSPDVSQQRVFHLIGLPGAGKGTLMRVEQALIGELNFSSPTIESIANRFWAEGLIGKSNLYVSDMDTSNGKALHTAANRLNTVSGGDSVSAERKNKINWEGRLPLHITVAGNRLPDYGSHTKAMLRRALVVPFDRSFKDNADRSLDDKLAGELTGILTWALDGLDRVRRNAAAGEDGFTEPQESRDAKLRMKYLSDPVDGFVDECCTIENGASVDKDLLHGAYGEFCEHQGARALEKNRFSERLHEIDPRVVPTRPRRKGKRAQFYKGIRLADEYLAERFKTDAGLIEMGFSVREALVRDAAGRPVPLDDESNQEDFP